MNKYDQLAARVQELVRESEYEKNLQYENEQVRASIVHAREDITLVAVHLSSVNRQLATVRRLLWVIAAVLVLQFLRSNSYL